MATRMKKLAFNVKRTLGFMKVFVRKKRGMLGIAIIFLFVAMALGASSIAPYEPTGQVNLSGYRAAPSWLKNIPGYTYLNDNYEAVADPGFKAPSSIREWSITSSMSQVVFSRYSSIMGDPLGSGAGSMAFTFRRDEVGTTYGDVKLVVSKVFDFSSTGPPQKFSGDIALFVEGTSTRGGDEGAALLDVPPNINVFIRTRNETFYVWPPHAPDNPIGITPAGDVNEATAKWMSAKTSPYSPVSTIDSTYIALKIRMYNQSGVTLDPARTVFNVTRGLPANFEWGVEITFKDSSRPESRVETTIYLDDLGFRTYGTAFGLLGTDQLGRDVFSQLVYGSRLSLYVGLLSTVIGVGMGLAVGLAAGYLGKVADELMMRFTDMLLIIPGLPLLIVLVSVLGPRLTNLVLLLGFLGWMSFARLVRSQVLSLRERPFVEAAKSIGAGRIHIITRHIMPNVMSLVWITLATAVPGNIMAEAALSWLGFYDPTVMSWGRMLHDVQTTSGAIANWWWVLPPGLSIALIAIAFILVGFSLDEILNPRLRRRA